MPEVADQVRARLLREPEGLYLNSAAEGLALASQPEAWLRYAEAKATGSRGRGEFDAIEREARSSFARLLGSGAEDIAFVASTSRGLDIAIKSIDWQPGDSFVTMDTEFPTTLFAAELLQTRGVDVRVVPSRDGRVYESDIVSAIDPSTRLVALSVVSFKTGQHLQFTDITRAAHAVGALVFADAVQALGAVEVSVGDVDFLCAATFKWLLGAHGVAVFFASQRAQDSLATPYVGYRSVAELFPGAGTPFRLHTDARRFDEGMPNFGALSIASTALQLFDELGVAAMVEHSASLARRLRAGLIELDIEYLCPDETMPRSPIVAFECVDFAEVGSRLAELGTTVWARDGRVRVAPHVYNTDAEVDLFLEQLSTLKVTQ